MGKARGSLKMESGFFKGNTMLFQVPFGFVFIPFELQAHGALQHPEKSPRTFVLPLPSKGNRQESGRSILPVKLAAIRFLVFIKLKVSSELFNFLLRMITLFSNLNGLFLAHLSIFE